MIDDLDRARIDVPALVENAVTLDAGVWRVPGADDFAYASDPFAERQLIPLLESTEDLSSGSDELAAQAGDWPARYYLSPTRLNLLAALPWRPDARVLEVGAGCGTITRLLGERFDDVVAVEGHPRRAHAARARTRDQPHVRVIAAPFDDLRFRGTFDVVFCIGVLEYAPQFSGTHAAMLQRLSGLLSDQGTLVVAIENKLGLKYLAGVAEDHTGVAFDGVEGYARTRAPAAVTLGRAELADALAAVGLHDQRWFYPFPDYKFPDALLTHDAALTGDPGILRALERPALAHPPGRPPRTFDQSAVWGEAMRNRLAPELSNSFLVLAGAPDRVLAPLAWDAVIFSPPGRPRASRALWRVEGLRTSAPRVRRIGVPSAEAPSHGRITVAADGEQTWHRAASVGAIARRAMYGADASLADVAATLRPWRDHLVVNCADDGTLAGELLDALPRNVVTGDDGAAVVLPEVVSRMRLDLSTVAARGLLDVLQDAVDRPDALVRYRGMRFAALMRDLARRLELPALDRRRLGGFAVVEAEVRSLLTGRAVTERDVLSQVRLQGLPGVEVALRRRSREVVAGARRRVRGR